MEGNRTALNASFAIRPVVLQLEHPTEGAFHKLLSPLDSTRYAWSPGNWGLLL